MDKATLFDKLRAGPWLVGALATAVVVAFIAPHQIGVLVWSLTKLAFGAYLGYWIDRSIFYYARPGEVDVREARQHTAVLLSACMLRRALIMAAAILALGLGV